MWFSRTNKQTTQMTCILVDNILLSHVWALVKCQAWMCPYCILSHRVNWDVNTVHCVLVFRLTAGLLRLCGIYSARFLLCFDVSFVACRKCFEQISWTLFHCDVPFHVRYIITRKRKHIRTHDRFYTTFTFWLLCTLCPEKKRSKCFM